MKRTLIVTGAGLGTTLLALIVAVLLGGPTEPVVESPSLLALVPGVILVGIASIATLAVFAGVFAADIRFAVAAWAIAMGASLVSLALTFGGDWPALIAWGALGAIVAEYLTTRHTRRWRKARRRAVERMAERKRVAEARRVEVVKQATRRVATDWLTDALGAPEAEGRVALLADLDPEAAWALARLHRKGVPAEYVAAHWAHGAPFDADTLVMAYRNGAAS